MHCYPTCDRSGLELSALLGPGGLVSGAEFAGILGGHPDDTVRLLLVAVSTVELSAHRPAKNDHLLDTEHSPF